MLRKAAGSCCLRAFPLLVLLGSSANAAPGWSLPLTVQSFVAQETGLSINVLDNSGNPMGCTLPTWLHINNRDPNFALVSSTILTTFSREKP